MPLHKNLTVDLHIPGVISATDPGAIGAGKLWIDIGVSGSPSAPVWKQRNAADSGWIDITVGGLPGGAQPLDATLTALAGLATGVAKIPYSTGTDVFGQLDLDADGTLAANSDTHVATQKAVVTFVAAAIAALVGTAPGVLDTLGEISDAINDDANLYTTLVAALALKAPLASPPLTGTPTAPTAAPGTNNTQISTTAYADAAAAAAAAGVSVPGTEAIQDAVGGGFDNVTLEYDDAANIFRVKAGGIGSTELASTAVTPGTYGDSSHYAIITVDADGRITSASNQAVSAGYTDEQAQDAIGAMVDGTTIEYIDATPLLRVKAGGIGANELASTTVTPGTYGDATHSPQITVDADGRITAASNVAVSGGGGGGGGGGTDSVLYFMGAII